MIAVRKYLLVVSFILIVSAGSAFASATNIYITQSGSPSGNCTTGVQTPSFVTAAGNWGSGPTQIGPGTTVLFCGTFSLPVSASLASFLGSGTSSNPITFKLDTGAIIQSGAMGTASSGAFNCSGQSWVTVDGGTNGIIRNADSSGNPQNGIGLTNKQASMGLYFSDCTNVIVKNLTVQDIFIGSPSDTAGIGSNTGDIYFGGNSTNSQVFSNTLTNSRAGLWVSFDSNSDASNFLVYGNNFSDHAWGLVFGAVIKNKRMIII